MQGRRRLVDTIRCRDIVVSSTVSRQLRNTCNLLLAGLILCAPRSVYALVVSALVSWCVTVFPWAIPRLIALGAVHALNGIGIGGSYIAILLTVEALPHTSRPIV
jgi:uncharacterized membrane protein